MNWKEQLSEIESHFGRREKRDWKPAVELVKTLVKKHSHDVEVYVRAIYLIHNILVEEDYPLSEHDEMANLLKQYFNKSHSLFSENAEYLFFTGKILHIAEWYFGLVDNTLAIEMQKKAMDKDQGNLLYEWAYRLSCPGDIVEGYLANHLIEHEVKSVVWLKNKGFPGSYVLEHLQTSNQKYLEAKASQ
jgi:hypothetical protein